MNKIIIITLGVLTIAAGCGKTQLTIQNPSSVNTMAQTPTPSNVVPTPKPELVNSPLLLEPISGGLSRITKKPFGLKVSPTSSPVSPEKFSGYHTGVDFETLPNEQDIEVPVSAACTGPVLLKKYATGYGGVLVQACKLESRDVTIIYGHLKLASITVETGKILTAGEKFAVLGQGYSQETDGERKHLHFGVYNSGTVNIKGYVQTQGELKAWLDPKKYLE